MAATAVTPSGVRDGDPDALAGLCAARGDAVLAYCEKVAGNAAAATAAAEAFGRFRAEVVATADLAALNPEALLVNATRHAAARHAGDDPAGTCGDVPLLLAARADRSISSADRERLERHLESCWACRARVARFKAAERAYRDPPGKPVSPDVASAIVTALATAAPVRGREPEPPPAPGPEPPPASAASNGAREVPSTEDKPPTADDAQPNASDDATVEYRPLRKDLYDEPYKPRYERQDRTARRSSNGNRRGGHGVLAALIARLGLRPNGEQALGATTSRPASEPRLVVGMHLPRPQRGLEPPLHGTYADGVLRPTAVMPIALIAIAVILALLVAGVFSGSDPASRPQSAAPALDPQSTNTPPKIVVVPGAKEAGAAAVELAKKRARAKRRREADLSRKTADAQATPSTDATPTPSAADAAPAPPVADPAPPRPPPPPPPPASGNANKPARDKGAGRPRVDTGTGATGSDQLPAQDTSSVPDLAPPDDSTLPPG